jgi:hypothetical protein
MALHVVHNQLLKQGQPSLVYPAIFTIMNRMNLVFIGGSATIMYPL